MSISVSARKAKGRKLQQNVRDLILEQYPVDLEPDDVRSTGMGQSGVDVQLSPLAKRLFPFSVEAKFQETTSIWAWLKQATDNVLKNTFPILIFKRSRSKTYVVLELDHFMQITKHTDFSKIFIK